MSIPFWMLAGVLGCSDYGYHEYEHVDVWYQNPADYVDVLLVVDNSHSMGPYQERLGTEFVAFLTYFVEADVDYQIGVVTTGYLETENPGVIEGQLITPAMQTDAAEALFDENVNVGTNGSGVEMGFAAGLEALSEPLISSANSGFLRDGAYLSVIFVSDEEDSSPMSVAEYLQAFNAIKDNERGRVNTSALTVTDKDLCDPELVEESSVGERYIDSARMSDGIYRNICEEDFEVIVTDLSLSTSRLNTTFYLSDLPDPRSLVVKIEGEEYPCEDGAWWFERQTVDGEDLGAIVFSESTMPAIYSKISAHYNSGSGDVALFCGG